MRLPVLNHGPEEIDEAESIKMLRYAIDHGVNYLDTGYPYNLGKHQRLYQTISRAFQGGYRPKVKIAASLPSPFIGSSREFDRYLNGQLEWLQTDRIDFYLLGGLNRETWPRLMDLGVLKWAEGAIADKRIDKLGFSFHDHYQALRDVLNSYDNWTLGQFQYSYMDTDHHPGIGGLKYAASRGLAVVVTEPLRKGRLASECPESVAKAWGNALHKHTLAEWGLRWVWDPPEVATVVSDMSNMGQVTANIALAERAQADSMNIQEKIIINQVREAYRRLRPVPCTACRACMPCPLNIDVPRIFEIYNDAVIYNDVKTAREIYRDERHQADMCNQCGSCVNTCAKKLAVLDWLEKARQLLAEEA